MVIITTKASASAANKPGGAVIKSAPAVKEAETFIQKIVINEALQDNLTLAENQAAEQANLALDHEAKTNMVLQELKQDNLYSNDKDYTLKITNSGMYINNVKQPDALFQKYRKYLPYPDKNVTYQTFEIKGRFREK